MPHGLLEAFVWLEGRTRVWSGITDIIQIACQISSHLSAECNTRNICTEKNKCLNMHWHRQCTNFQPNERNLTNENVRLVKCVMITLQCQENITFPTDTLARLWVYPCPDVYWPSPLRCSWLWLPLITKLLEIPSELSSWKCCPFSRHPKPPLCAWNVSNK